MIKTIKKANQELITPNKLQAITLTKSATIKIGFLKFLVSASVPQIGPIKATNKVAIEAA